MLEAGTALDLKDEVVHDGVLLMDRALSSGAAAPPELLPLVAAASLRLSAAQGGGPDAAPRADAAAAAAGVDAGAMGVMEWQLQQLLGGDTLAISTMRCLKVYLERLGYRWVVAAPCFWGGSSAARC
jgi:pentatricopeptide repeat domain-containing protein 1